MSDTPPTTAEPEVFSVDEIANAASATSARVRDLIDAGHAPAFGGFVAAPHAIALVRLLTGRPAPGASARAPLTLPPDHPRGGRTSLAASGALHIGLAALLGVAASLGWLSPNDTEQRLDDPVTPRLVFLIAPGPGGGGGGGGLSIPAPPPPARRKAETPPVRRVSNPVPPVRRVPPPPRPPVTRPPRPIEPTRVEPLVTTPRPEPPPAINAPVVPIAADPVTLPGLPVTAPAAPPSPGPGTGGGAGSGSGTGLGEGTGSGIGAGSGGGTGGGPYQPGSGIDPPVLLREIKPAYTTEARRQAVEGDVVLEIVVRRDGTVGAVRVLRSLGAGLDQKAVEAVRQWRFGPARRHGSPVDVVVEVSVEFSLR